MNLEYGEYLLLIVVCSSGYLDIVIELIFVGVDVNLKFDIFLLIIIVCFYGYLDIVVELIKVGVSVNLY